MSYSFNVRGATKALALAVLAAKLDEVVQQQPVHAADRQQAQAAAEAFVGLLPDDASKEVHINISGYVSGQWSGSDLVQLSGASVSVSASLVTPAG
ncbi:UNVERIFIED_ORG: hypothetical protein LHJ69_12950 [Shinella sp. XGS7]|nr:hypothetical protein [Shinella sp. XGS7]